MRKISLIFFSKFFIRFPLLNKIFFVKNLALMLRAGLPIREAIAAIKSQFRNKRIRNILDGIISNIDNGHSLADSLAKYPTIFDHLFVNIIRVGEESGSLEKNLDYLALRLEKSYDLRRKIKAAMIYPVIVLVSTATLAAALSLLVLPKLLPLFKSFKIKLPLTTRILIFLTELIQNQGIFIFITILFFILIVIFLSRLKPIKLITHRLFLVIPVISSIAKNKNLAQFTRTLGILLKSGISLVEALEITAQTFDNVIYKNYIMNISVGVQRGNSVSSFLKENVNLFPPIISQLIQVGEKTGTLEEALFYMADFCEKEVDGAVKNLSIVIEPVLLIIIGLAVAFVALAIITPIYQINSGIRP